MVITFSLGMLRSIDIAIEACRVKSEMMDVYRVAEVIQRLHPEDNVAIEDVITKIVLHAGANVAVGFLPNDPAAQTITFPSNVLPPEFMMEVGDITPRSH